MSEHVFRSLENRSCRYFRIGSARSWGSGAHLDTGFQGCGDNISKPHVLGYGVLGYRVGRWEDEVEVPCLKGSHV